MIQQRNWKLKTNEGGITRQIISRNFGIAEMSRSNDEVRPHCVDLWRRKVGKGEGRKGERESDRKRRER